MSYIHYEKPTTTNVLVQRRSALEENSKHQILSNDLVRRLGNVDEMQGKKVIKDVVDKYSQKLLTSGYNMTQTRKIILAGIRGWESKRDRARREQRRVHRTSRESMKNRIMKKATGKNNWFRRKKDKKSKSKSKDDRKSTTGQTGEHIPEKRKHGGGREEPLRTAAVLFVENTKEGKLAKDLRSWRRSSTSWGTELKPWKDQEPL